MARRRRSYKANSDKLLSTAFNNYLVASEKKKKAEARERAKASREYERSAAKRAREKEAERKIAERKIAKEKKAIEREQMVLSRQLEMEERKRVQARAADQKKIDAIISRLSIELSNNNFLLSDRIIREVAEECFEASITPAKAYTTYVAPREDELRSKMIDAFVEDRFKLVRQSMVPDSEKAIVSKLQNRQNELRNELHALSKSDEIITDLNRKATELEAYSECVALLEKLEIIIDSEIKKQEQMEAEERAEAAERKQSRDDFFITHRLDIFEEDLQYLMIIAEAQDLDSAQLESSQDYLEAKAKKSSYVNKLVERLRVFKINNNTHSAKTTKSLRNEQ
jgi:hypothetical protein